MSLAALERQYRQLLDAKRVVDKYGAAAREYAALEQTQDIPGRTVAGEYHTNGVFRIDRSAGYECHRYAPELSMEQNR